MGIESPIDTIFLIALAVILIIITCYSSLSTLKNISTRTLIVLISLRAVAALSIFLLLLKPYYIVTKPDPAAGRVVALADVSGSMQEVDNNDNLRRIDHIRSALDITAKDSWINTLRKTLPVEIYCFAKDVIPFSSNALESPLEGKSTAIGNALLQMLNTSGKPLSSIIVFTDGNNNFGSDIFEAAREFRKKGIPINIIGVGEILKNGDLEVHFEKNEMHSVVRRETEIKVIIKNSFTKSMTSEATLWHKSKALKSVPVEIPPDGQSQVHFKITPEYRGLKTYKVTINTDPEDNNKQNDIDRLLLSVEEAEQLRLLYISDQLQLNYRFLKNNLENSDRFEFNSIIQIGKSRFYIKGKDMPKGFPEDEKFWFRFDAVILNTGVLSKLSEPVLRGLKQFVNKRGGGLLAFGELDNPNRILGGLLPVRKTKKNVIRDNQFLMLYAEPIFTPEDNISRMRLYLPKGLPNNIFLESSIAARTVAYTRSGNTPALLVQAYGAGKTAYWGTEHDWIWVMESDKSRLDYNRFWYAIADWLGTGGAERIKIESNKLLYPAEEPVKLIVDILGKNFEVAVNAIVEAIVNTPDEKEKIIQLFPKADEPGRYEAAFRPAKIGGYDVNYRVVFPEDEILEKETFFSVAYSKGENLNTRFKEADLQKIAYLTNGHYFHYRNLDQAQDIAVSNNLPPLEIRQYPTMHFFFLLLVVSILGAEWIIRRRGGLR